MAKQTLEREISKGTCHFCQGEFAKNKMTQHLKTCKARAALVTEQKGDPTRLLHLMVEGTNRPSYWMHLEVPAEATLSDVDDFLRAVWLECCGHLSEFTIGGESYISASENDWGGGLELLEGDSETTGEQTESKVVADQEQPLPSASEMASQIAQELTTELGADLKKMPVEEIEKKLEQMFAANLPSGMQTSALTALKPLLGYMASALQEGTLAEELEEFEEEGEEEQDMEVELGEVLNVGDKFSYVYDFGSSTNLSLLVIAERDGVMLMPPDEEEAEDEELDDDESQISLVIMAHNEPPAFVCRLCGKPGAFVSSSEEFNDLESSVFCESCAQKQQYPDELLPMVNSPRVGVCGYTGDSDEEDWEDDEDEDEDEE